MQMNLSSRSLIPFLLCIALISVSIAADHTKDSLDTVKKNLAEKKAVLIDVREQEEWDEEHLKQAIHLPLSKIEDGITAEELQKIVPRKTIVYTHCAAGIRSLKAAKLLAKQLPDVRPLKPGVDKLHKAGFPMAD